MSSAICFHGTEITCDMVSPEHADVMGFIYRESEIREDGSFCIVCGKPMIQGHAQIMKVFGLELESAHLYCEDGAKAIWEARD